MRVLPGLLLIIACTEAPTSSTHRQAIVGGRPAPSDDFVFFLETAEGGCSAALIAPRTLLTAAHCVASGGSRWATNGPRSDAGLAYSVVAHRTFAEGSDGGSPVDLALALLDRAPPSTPMPWVWSGPAPVFGTLIRHVGYGRTESAEPGERNSVEVAVSVAAETKSGGIVIETGRPGLGICFGDSGGPALVRLDGGSERVLAVHSFVVGACGSGTSVLLYPYRGFIESWLQIYEPPGCARDGRCVSACGDTVDPDCTCPADGHCDLRCPPFDDLDCPVSCGPDGFCETTSVCPIDDADCVPLGGACTRDMQCAERRCITDPQHAEPYCSRGCDANIRCPAPLVCEVVSSQCQHPQLPEVAEGEPCDDGVTACVTGTRCAPVGGRARCRRACSSQAQCKEGTRCQFEGLKICAPEEITLERATVEARAAKSGCSVMPEGLAMLLGGVLLWWLRAARRAR